MKRKSERKVRDDDEAKAKKIYPADEPITVENAGLEATKALREVRDFFRSLTVTPAGRIRTTAYTRGGAVEDIRRTLIEINGAKVKAKKKAGTTESTDESVGGKAFAGLEEDNKKSESLPA